MYLFTISYGSYALDQTSWDGWFSGWSQIFAFYQRHSWARLWVARRENCLSTEQNHPEYPLQEKGQSGGNESSKRRPFPSRKTDCLPDPRILPGHWGQWFCRELHRPIHHCSSKWRYSGIRFEMGRNFIINDENPIWWHLGNFVQIKNTTVWETQDRIEIVQYHSLGNQSERFREFLYLISRFEFVFVAAEFFLNDSNFWCVQSSITHTMWPYMCMCCSLFAPTQFHFECCGVFDDSR